MAAIISSRRTWLWLVGFIVAAGLSAATLWFRYGGRFGAGQKFSGTYQQAVVTDLDVRLTKDGELQAINFVDVINRVEGINTVQELVREGTYVKRGDKLIVLDSSNIQKAFDTSLLELQEAEATLATAKESKDIQEATNKAVLQAAELDLEVAKIDLREYTEGVFPQKEAEARTKLQMAVIMVKNKEEDLATTRNLFARGFVTAADLKKAELDVLTVKNDHKKAETDLMVLIEFTNAKELATKKSAVAQAEQKLERTKKENAALLSKSTYVLKSAEQQLNLRKQLHSKLEEQLQNCVIRAPADGLVVYTSSGDRDRDPLKEGGNVRNQQSLIKLPDTSHMKAVIRVPEGQVTQLRVDESNPMRATVNVVGLRKPIGASLSKISVLADSGQRFWNPDLKEFPVELVLDETPPNSKPGLTAKVEILIDRRKQVVAVPMTSLYYQGNQSFVFVREAGREYPKPVEVKVGVINETHAEIVAGLSGGQDVLLLQPGQGRVLLEKAGINVAPPQRPGDIPGRGGGRRRPPANNPAGNTNTTAAESGRDDAGAGAAKVAEKGSDRERERPQRRPERGPKSESAQRESAIVAPAAPSN
jgi:multidrug efflux pump subunit AcrA (membrane-fusion protein)